MKTKRNKWTVFLANLVNMPTNSCNGSLSDSEIEDLTYKMSNGLFFKKRARNVLFERLKEQKELLPRKGFDIIDKLYASDIDNELAALIVDKMQQYGFGFMSLETGEILKMIRKIGFSKFIDFFKDDDSSFETFLNIFAALDENEKKQTKNIKMYIAYFAKKGLRYVETIGAEPIIKIIKNTVSKEKAQPNSKKRTAVDYNDCNWFIYFTDGLFKKLYTC